MNTFLNTANTTETLTHHLQKGIIIMKRFLFKNLDTRTHIKHAMTIERQVYEPKCSAFATQAVLKYKGIDASVDELYDSFDTFHDGAVKPETIVNALKNYKANNPAYGAVSPKIKMDSDLRTVRKQIEMDKPVIVLAYADVDSPKDIDELHYMVLTGIDSKNVYLLDSLKVGAYPMKKGKNYNRVESISDFLKMWDISECEYINTLPGVVKNICLEI